MTTGLIIHTVLGLLLLVIPAGLLYLWDRKLLRSFGIALARMAAQLLALCLLVWLLYRFDQLWLSLLWVVALSAYAAVVVVGRVKLDRRAFLLPVALALLAGCLPTGLYLLYAVLPADRVLSARWLVPLTALLTGHATTALIRGLNTYYTGLKADEQHYEFLRGNGKDHLQSVMPFVRRTLQAVLAPTTANLAQMGLFTMPLLLVGLLLAGMEPLYALFHTFFLAIGCVAASVLTVILALWLCDRRLFDAFGKLMMLAVVLSALSCKGNTHGDAGGDVDRQDAGFYDAEAAAKEPKTVQKSVTMYELPAPLKDRPEQILHRKGYTASYNQTTKTPNWVAWHLTEGHTTGRFQRSDEVFAEDEEVSRPRATDNDYYNSRYDRGHMCPAGDNKWDKVAMSQSFLFTNICPQNHGLNKYEWNDLEIQCREWARKYGSVDIVCGPVYDEGSARQTIGRNKVWVPERFFKVVLCRKGKPKAIGFLYRNEGKKQLMEEAVRTVDEIEALTGIDFFPALDDQTEAKIEATASLKDW